MVAPGFARAQGQGGASGTIKGTITDSQELTLPAATVEVQNSQGTTVKKIVGRYDGSYRVADVPIGTYAVRFSRDGFQSVRKDAVVVAAGLTVTLDAALQPQARSSTVTVTAQVDDQNVASKTDIPASDLPVTVNTVSRDMIEQQNLTDIVPAINNLCAANAWTQYGSLNYFEFRGQIMDQDPGSAILLNGIPIQGNRSDSQVNSVQEVDVLKGPASMLYGTQDPGGTINIVEKQPLAARQQELVLRGGYWGTGGIEFGSTGPLGTSENLLYRIDVGFSHSDGFRGAGYNRFDLVPKLYWRLTPRDRLRFNVNWNDDHFDMDAGIPLLPLADPLTATTPYGFVIPPIININNRYNTPGNFEYLNSPIGQVFYEHDFNDNLTLRSSAQFQYGSDEYWQDEGNAIDVTSLPYQVLRGDSINENTFSLFFFHHDFTGFSQTDLKGSFHVLGKHQFLIGYEFDRMYHKTERSDEAENLPIPSISLYNPVETATAVTNFPPSSYDGLNNTQNAIYFQDFWNIHPKLQLLLGGRYDAYRHYDFDYPVVDGVWQYGGPQDKFAQNPFTYRAGIISPLFPHVVLFANWATSFTAQTELSLAGNALKPETGEQFEGGMRFKLLQDRVSLNMDYFHITEFNVAQEQANGYIFQGNRVKSSGAEVELRARVTQKLNLYASYGYTEAALGNFVVPSYFSGYSVDQNFQGNVPGLVPKQTERVWVTYNLPKGFLLMVGDRYVSRRATDNYDLFFMPGFVTFDAALQYRWKKWEYDVNVYNLFNRQYWVSSIDDTQVYPGAPINVTGTIRYRF
jgi:iron complex outermembrane recepter protein